MNDQSDFKKGKTAPFDLSKLSLTGNETAIVPDGKNRVKRMLEDAQGNNEVAVVKNPKSVALVVRGMEEALPFGAGKTNVILGRIDQRTSERPDVDLSHLGAAERGVSRRHARLEYKDDHLYLTDLNSSNGTFLRRERLNPYTPTIIQPGDEVLLGRLALQIVFE